jgi:hypothetical protein
MRFRIGLSLTALLVGGGILVTVVGTASAQTKRVTDDWVTLRPPGGGFRILMPPDWKQTTPRDPNEKLSFVAKLPAPSGRPGVTNCNVGVEAIPNNFTQADIDEVYKSPAGPETIQPLASGIPDFSLRENRLVRVSNQPAWFMTYLGSYDLNAKKVYMVMASVMLSRRGQAYTVTCFTGDMTPQLDEAAWNAWQPIIMLILGTFTVEDL